ncbi:MAG: multidrug effflux MFS transporter [Pseudomonadota bacterium]
MNAPTDNPNHGLATRTRFILTLGMLTSMSAFTVDLSLPALPAAADALGTSMSSIQSVVGLYIAGFGLGQLPAGFMADRVGRRPVLFVGLAVFIVGGIVSGLATSSGALLASRFVQGLGGASAAVLARTIVRDVSQGTHAARLMSLLIMLVTAAPMLAPTLGGLLVDLSNWRSPFLASALLGLAATAMVLAFLPDTHRPAPDLPPLAQQAGRSIRNFFAERESVFGLILLSVFSAGFMAMIAGASTVVDEVYGYSPTAFGLIFALAGASFLVGSLFSRAWVHRLGLDHMIRIGVLVMGAAGIFLLVCNALGTVAIGWFWGSVCLQMFGAAFFMPNATALALERLPHMAGAGASILGTLQGVTGWAGALLGAMLYNGTISSISIMLGVAGLANVALYFALRKWASADQADATVVGR